MLHPRLGNLMMVHNWGFVSDIWTILMACGAKVRLMDINGSLTSLDLYGFEKVHYSTLPDPLRQLTWLFIRWT